MKMEIQYYDEYTQIEVSELPMTDEMIKQITNMYFWDFINTTVRINARPDMHDDEYLDINEFVDKYLTYDQKEMIYDYFRQNMDKLENKFSDLAKVKCAI